MKKLIKIAFISLIGIVLIWVILFILNYTRVSNDQESLLTVKVGFADYPDGYSHSYTSCFGYTMVYNHRESKKSVDVIPFWRELK